VIFAFGTLGDASLVPCVAAVYYQKADSAGALGAIVGGALTNIVWTAVALDRVPGVHQFLAGPVVSAVGFAIFILGRARSSETRSAVRRRSVRASRGYRGGSDYGRPGGDPQKGEEDRAA
jgi:sodium/proline symporter